MNLKLRRARPSDAEGLFRVKKSLPMPTDSSETAHGGFLLGTNIETYRFFIENAYTNVLEKDEKIVGFAIILPDNLLRNSEIWQRKDQIDWENFAVEKFENKPVCYFEQLAILPNVSYRFFGVALAYLTLTQAFKHHEAMFATIVKEPIFNQASIAFLENIGGCCVGTVDEFLPEFGNLVSKVYFVDREVFAETTAKHRIIKKIERQIRAITNDI
jgi:hypothetical protein